MSDGLPEPAIAGAFLDACAQELEALKPGNVHVHAAGHRMTVDDFRRSAAAAAPALCRRGHTLGGRVLGAVEATRAAVGQNTNLGIVLLCAPLAMAAERRGALADAVAAVIAESDMLDAAQVFAAITLAAPAGLGQAEHDVRRPATVPLGVAMAAASGHDSVARQWAIGFTDILVAGVRAYAGSLARCGQPLPATTGLYLGYMAQWPDSHVRRKHGPATAEALRLQALPFWRRLRDADDHETITPDLLAWDADLKRRGINPGTSADLTVATVFAWRLLRLRHDAGIERS